MLAVLLYKKQKRDIKNASSAKGNRCLMRFVYSIDDSLTRQIFTLRYCAGHIWVDVAAKVGGNNTEDSVKKIVYRYLNK